MTDSAAGSWLRTRTNDVMWCVTFTYGIGPEDVLARYGADPRDARLLAERDAGPLYGSHHPDGSVLRAGALGGWSFCFEDCGIMGVLPGPLTALSWRTETLALHRSAKGMSRFAHWRDGFPSEGFEPGFPGTRGEPPHPWWDAVQARRDATGEEFPGLVPVLEAIADHTGAVLDADTLAGPLLTLRLADTLCTPDPVPYPLPRPRSSRRPLGRYLGPVVACRPADPRVARNSPG
ncbi:DUF6461 domain-containing protein [Streptomyces laurentii]|uniref:DUF6461 domain-containing protein n=1 Tax=Streptomyces laurentii TaxID=39478 RepID=UPI0036BD2CDA